MTEAKRTQHGYLLGNIPLFLSHTLSVFVTNLYFGHFCYYALFTNCDMGWPSLLLNTVPSATPPVSWVRCNPSTFISLLCLIFLVAVGFLYWILLLSCIKLAKTCILKGAVYWTEAVWVGDVYETPTPIVGMDKKVRLDTLMCGKRLDFYLGHADVCMPWVVLDSTG